MPRPRWQLSKRIFQGAVKITVKDGQLWDSIFSGGKPMYFSPRENVQEETQKKETQREEARPEAQSLLCPERQSQALLWKIVLKRGL